MSILQQILITLLAALTTGFVGFRLGIVAERHNSKRESQLKFVPLLKRVIARLYAGHPLSIWPKVRDDVESAVWEFEMHLKWPRRRKFESAWEECQKVKNTDLFPNNEPGFVSKGEAQDVRDAQDKIVNPLLKLLQIAEKA
jgi:hypothetical protein